MNVGPDAPRASGGSASGTPPLPFVPPPSIGEDERYRKLERLRKREEFLRVQGSRNKASTATVVVLCARGGYPWTRLGVTVSRKVGNAVVRSGVKRRLREIFRTTKPAWADGHDFVVIARARASEVSWDELRADVLSCVTRLTRRVSA